jgi:cytochrome c oxidase subunit III
MATESIAAHNTELEESGAWSGGQSPFKTSYGKIMMWYFLLSDAFTFSGFLIAYGALRFSSQFWPAPDVVFAAIPFFEGHFPLIFVTFMSFALIFSSVTMVRAVQEGHRENKDGVVKWMIATIIGGSVFLGCQAFEWTHLMHEGLTIFTDPFVTSEVAAKFGVDPNHALANYEYVNGIPTAYLEGNQLTPLETPPPAFGALFFFITGFHGFHVFSGLVFLAIIAINAASGLYASRKNGYEMVEKIGLYWHFVDLVWVFVFLVFYLL